MELPSDFELVRRAPVGRLRGLIYGITGYHERSPGAYAQLEEAALVVPLIVSLGTPFRIALDRAPRPDDRQPSFVAGLYPGPVHIHSDGAAECVQVDFTPLGAYRFLGGAVVELAGRMVDVVDALGADAARLRDLLAETRCWQRRFDLMEEFVASRTLGDLTAEVAHAYRRLASAGGDVRIDALAREIGWSRKHLADRFRAQIGLGPKSVARVMRFRRACRLARTGEAGGWAGIAAECGFADQAHLVREFAVLAGEAPTAWAQRLAATDGRMVRPERDPAAC